MEFTFPKFTVISKKLLIHHCHKLLHQSICFCWALLLTSYYKYSLLDSIHFSLQNENCLIKKYFILKKNFFSYFLSKRVGLLLFSSKSFWFAFCSSCMIMPLTRVFLSDLKLKVKISGNNICISGAFFKVLETSLFFMFPSIFACFFYFALFWLYIAFASLL